MAFFQNAYYTCNCEKEKCDRDCLEFRKMTHTESNGDMIRSMTDEELAEYLFYRGNGSEYCYGICAYQDECEEYHTHEFCIGQIVKWLKQEVDDGNKHTM